MKKISILGSTGSIGKSALEVVNGISQRFEIVALTANENYKELSNQIKKYKPKYVSIGTEEGYRELKKEYPDLNIFQGEEGLKTIGSLDEHDILLTAVSGAVGIEATIEAIKKGKRIALANKETMVSAGEIINKKTDKYKAEIIPVDSEHSALFQALKSGKSNEVKRLILTASGGPFRRYKEQDLKEVTLEEALKHPRWKMGRKITVDSATLVNKGLEVIEAHYLFKMNYEKIDVVVHPESIVHSFVEFCDNSLIAQMGTPDMKLPIQYAFFYPDRVENPKLSQLDLFDNQKLTFERPDMEVFKGLKLAYEAGKVGKNMPLTFNAANETAVELFLAKKIGFLDIYRIIEETMSKTDLIEINSVDDIKAADREAREKARRVKI